MRYGDIDFDGKLTDNDSLMIAQYLAGYLLLSDVQKERADVDGSNEINSSDVMFIGQAITGVLWAKADILTGERADTARERLAWARPDGDKKWLWPVIIGGAVGLLALGKLKRRK